MTYGFLGTGTITEAIVTGLLSTGEAERPIILSPRGESTARRLAELSASVSIAADNQAVVDAADIVFLAIRPQIAESVIAPLVFRDGQLVISLVAAIDLEQIGAWIGGADVRLARAVPLPFCNQRMGVTAIFPDSAETAAIFGALSEVVTCSEVAQFEVFSAASAVMGTYFGLQETAIGWMTGHGIAETQARTYIATLFHCLGVTVQQRPETSLPDLREEFSTKGGLNEQLFRTFDEKGGTGALLEALSQVLERVRAPQR